MLSEYTIKRMDDVVQHINEKKLLINYVHTINPHGKRNRHGWVDVVLKSSNRKNAKVTLVISYDVYKGLKFDIKSRMAGDLYRENIAAYSRHLAIKNRGAKLERLGILD